MHSPCDTDVGIKCYLLSHSKRPYEGALLPPHFTDAEADPAEASPPSEPQAEFAVLMNAVRVETVGMGQDRQNPTTSLKLQKADGAA